MSSPRAPRMFVCTASTVISVHGSGPQGLGFRLTAGAQVDFDQVIGAGADGPVTLEQALGHYATTCFAPAHPAGASAMAQDDEE